MNLHINHIESDNGPVPYWHRQRILFTQASFTAERGIGRNLAVEAAVPFRVIRERIRFEDLSGQPFSPSPPDGHHRNETLTRVSDPRVLLHFGTVRGAWGFGVRGGTSIPLGTTVPNPFELGRLGLPHEHIQLGTGTWDPIASIAVSRALGSVQIQAGIYGRFALYENSHGYRAGNLYDVNLTGSRRIRGPWGGFLGADFTREEAERWSGRLEEEGNLGRSDASLSVGAGRPVPGIGNLSLTTIVPVHSEAKGEQAHLPLAFSLRWTPF